MEIIPYLTKEGITLVFKIDLIVWKFSSDVASGLVKVVFKIDLIVWKLYNFISYQ